MNAIPSFRDLEYARYINMALKSVDRRLKKAQ